MPPEIKSPCESVCLFDDGVCTTCRMTNAESTAWKKMTEEERIGVLTRLGLWPPVETGAAG